MLYPFFDAVLGQIVFTKQSVDSISNSLNRFQFVNWPGNSANGASGRDLKVFDQAAYNKLVDLYNLQQNAFSSLNSIEGYIYEGFSWGSLLEALTNAEFTVALNLDDVESSLQGLASDLADIRQEIYYANDENTGVNAIDDQTNSGKSQAQRDTSYLDSAFTTNGWSLGEEISTEVPDLDDLETEDIFTPYLTELHVDSSGSESDRSIVIWQKGFHPFLNTKFQGGFDVPSFSVVLPEASQMIDPTDTFTCHDVFYAVWVFLGWVGLVRVYYSTFRNAVAMITPLKAEDYMAKSNPEPIGPFSSAR